MCYFEISLHLKPLNIYFNSTIFLREILKRSKTRVRLFGASNERTHFTSSAFDTNKMMVNKFIHGTFFSIFMDMFRGFWGEKTLKMGMNILVVITTKPTTCRTQKKIVLSRSRDCQAITIYSSVLTDVCGKLVVLSSISQPWKLGHWVEFVAENLRNMEINSCASFYYHQIIFRYFQV